MSRDFTLAKYARLCQAIQQLACPVMTMCQFLEAGQPRHMLVVLRHDIDRSLASAVRMAELESGYGIRATYYARVTRSVFRPAGLKRLAQLGHEVGYHYEVLARARGDHQKAIQKFAEELALFRQVIPVTTISMHGSPLSPWNNLDLWQTVDFAAYGLLGEAYLSVDYSELHYFTDTGRTWDATRYNIRDRVASRHSPTPVHSTDDLISFLTGVADRPVLLNTHPNRWTTGLLAWSTNATADWLINQVKWLAARFHRKFNIG
ncbi:MAG: hypothetical protein L0332_01065 [Chloroflexi bacterium]|nr:hypothetical protein [Chloroflexota bacterium]MCI0645241.1 hypothetical protein [Chloroflexota bacterium]MCI0725313.1 hypothetical protein [Chloroflexota bacterium]